MIPPEHLDYYMTEWITASLEAIVAHRLFPSIGFPYSRRVNVIRPTHEQNERWPLRLGSVDGASRRPAIPNLTDSHGSEDDSAAFLGREHIRACQFSEDFIPESARHFQVEIPQIESLRAALLSNPKFNLHFMWQLRVVVVLHTTTPIQLSTHGGQQTGASTPQSSKVRDVKATGNRSNAREFGSQCESTCRPPVWFSGSLGDVSVPSSNGLDGRGCVSPVAGLVRGTDGQAPCFLEQWILSFRPSPNQDWNVKFEHRKLCTALKGLMAAIHFLPTHSALLALKTSEDAGGGRAEGQSPFVETHICARWHGQEARVRLGRTPPPAWTPVASYRSDLEGALSCRSFEVSREAEGDARNQVGASQCRTAVLSSPASRTARSSQKHSSLGTKQGQVLRFQQNVPLQCATERGELGGSEAGGLLREEPQPPPLDCMLLGKSWLKQHAVSAAGESAAQSLPTISCHSSAVDYAASSSMKLETCEARSLLSVATSLGSVECAVTYNEELAQSIVAAKELEAIDGCLEEFHPIADSCVDRGSSECPEDGGTVVSDSDPWLDMEDPCSWLEGILPHGQHQLVQGAEASVGTLNKGTYMSKESGSFNKQEGGGLWFSLQGAAGKRASHLPSVRACVLGLTREKQPAVQLKFPADAAAASGVGDAEGVEGPTWVPWFAQHPVNLPDSSTGAPYIARGVDGLHLRPSCCQEEALLRGAPSISRDACGMAAAPDGCEELGGEGGGEFGEHGLKPEEGALLGDNEFGAMWLNSATSFSLATELPECSSPPAFAESSGLGSALNSEAADFSSLMQRIREVFASEEARASLNSMKYLSDALHALERVASQLLPDALTFSGLLPAGAETSGASSLQSNPAGSKRFRLSDCWRDVSLDAAAVGAQQGEDRALRELCLAELDPEVLASQWAGALDEDPAIGAEQSHGDLEKETWRPQQQQAAVSAGPWPTQTSPALESDFEEEPTRLQQYLSRLRTEDGRGWLKEEGEDVFQELDGHDEQAALSEARCRVVPGSPPREEKPEDPWDIQKLISALKTFEEVEDSHHLSLGLSRLT
ncbi:hypothetical protein Efla_005024 [Eimeria flavescens]